MAHIYYTRTAKRIYENYLGQREVLCTVKQDNANGLWSWRARWGAGSSYTYKTIEDALQAFCTYRKLPLQIVPVTCSN